jgi:tRNA A37 threonylcarbamoyladenosine dehydratase
MDTVHVVLRCVPFLGATLHAIWDMYNLRALFVSVCGCGHVGGAVTDFLDNTL